MTPLDQAAIDIIFSRVKLFLWGERCRGNEEWFSVADIADHFGQRPPLIPFILALKELAATGQVQGDEEGRVRHV